MSDMRTGEMTPYEQAVWQQINLQWADKHHGLIAGLRDGSLVAVPREPTMVMLQAVCKADDKAYACGSINGADFETLWAVALDAAKGSQQ